jgi:hypothetical protein
MKEGRRAIILKKKEARQNTPDFKNVDYNKSETYELCCHEHEGLCHVSSGLWLDSYHRRLGSVSDHYVWKL